MPTHKKINSVITLTFALATYGFGVAALIRAIHWVYLVATGSKEFEILTAIVLFVIVSFLLFIGYTLHMISRK